MVRIATGDGDPKIRTCAIRAIVLADKYAREISASSDPISCLPALKQRTQSVAAMAVKTDANKEMPEEAWLAEFLYTITVTLLEREGIIPPQGIRLKEFPE